MRNISDYYTNKMFEIRKMLSDTTECLFETISSKLAMFECFL